MTDLALATWEEIQAEIAKRFPLWAFVIAYHPEGRPALGYATRCAWGFNADHALLVGKVELLKLSIAAQVMSQQQTLRPDQGLDDLTSHPPENPYDH